MVAPYNFVAHLQEKSGIVLSPFCHWDFEDHHEITLSPITQEQTQCFHPGDVCSKDLEQS